MAITIGVDIGKMKDPTAVAVVETERREFGGRIESHFTVRHLERLPLGTPYPRVAERIARITDQVRAKTEESPTVFVDSTGLARQWWTSSGNES